jgi:hypothetical protein
MITVHIAVLTNGACSQEHRPGEDRNKNGEEESRNINAVSGDSSFDGYDTKGERRLEFDVFHKICNELTKQAVLWANH